MKDMFIRFIKEEDGMGTVEMVVIVAVLLGIALIFRKSIFNFVGSILDKIFNQGELKSVTDNPLVSPTPSD